MRRHSCTCCRSAGRTTAGMRWPLENVPVSAASRETASVTTFSGPSAADHAFSASSSCELRMPLPSGSHRVRHRHELGRFHAAPHAAEDVAPVLSANYRRNSQVGHQARNALAISRVRKARIESQDLHQAAVLWVVVRLYLLAVRPNGSKSDPLQYVRGTVPESGRRHTHGAS